MNHAARLTVNQLRKHRRLLGSWGFPARPFDRNHVRTLYHSFRSCLEAL